MPGGVDRDFSYYFLPHRYDKCFCPKNGRFSSMIWTDYMVDPCLRVLRPNCPHCSAKFCLFMMRCFCQGRKTFASDEVEDSDDEDQDDSNADFENMTLEELIWYDNKPREKGANTETIFCSPNSKSIGI